VICDQRIFFTARNFAIRVVGFIKRSDPALDLGRVPDHVIDAALGPLRALYNVLPRRFRDAVLGGRGDIGANARDNVADPCPLIFNVLNLPAGVSTSSQPTTR
jgi:hypothetical protein